MEPADLTWCVFGAFGFETAEIRWTKWIASLLNGTSGAIASRLTWSALARAIAGVAPLPRRSFWFEAASAELFGGAVQSELTVDDLGRADLVTTPTRSS